MTHIDFTEEPTEFGVTLDYAAGLPLNYEETPTRVYTESGNYLYWGCIYCRKPFDRPEFLDRHYVVVLSIGRKFCPQAKTYEHTGCKKRHRVLQRMIDCHTRL